MSGKSRLDVVVRVAELREREARIHLAGTQLALVAAQSAARSRIIELTNLRPNGPTNADGLRHARTVAGYRADAARQAEVRADAACSDQTTALAAWTDAATREKALLELAARHLAAEEATRQAREQRRLDDLRPARRDGEEE